MAAPASLSRKSRSPISFCAMSRLPELEGYGVLQALFEDRTISGTPFVFLTAKGEKRDQRAGMNLGADDYLTKPVTATDLLAAVCARLDRESKRPAGEFTPDFTSATPLESALGLTPREAEVLLWVAQGKSNGDVATILQMSEKTVKQHLGSVFQKIGVESRTAASLRAVEVLSSSGS